MLENVCVCVLPAVCALFSALGSKYCYIVFFLYFSIIDFSELINWLCYYYFFLIWTNIYVYPRTVKSPSLPRISQPDVPVSCFIFQVYIPPQEIRQSSAACGLCATVRQCAHQRKTQTFTLAGVKPVIGVCFQTRMGVCFRSARINTVRSQT